MRKLLCGLMLVGAVVGCTAVHIEDGAHSALIGEGRTKDVCEVHVSKSNKSTVTYESDTCKIQIVGNAD